jgi:hypothetical protein
MSPTYVRRNVISVSGRLFVGGHAPCPTGCQAPGMELLEAGVPRIAIFHVQPAHRLPHRPRQGHRGPRQFGSGELTASTPGPADSMRHDVIGRPRGPHSRGQGALRAGRAGPARPPRSSRPTGSTSAAGWCRRGGPWRTGGTRPTTSTPRTRPARPSAGCGGAASSSPGSGAHRHRRGARRHPF